MNFLKKTLITVTALVLVAFLGFQVYQRFAKPYKTETAYEYTQSDSVSANGIVIRNEQLIEANYSGVLSYYVEDGGKVAKDSTVAETFQNGDQAVNKKKLEAINKEIEMLKSSQDAGSSASVSLETLSNLVMDKATNLIGLAESGYLKSEGDYANDLLALLNRKQIVTQKVTDFNDRIAQLESEKQSVIEAMGSPTKSFTTPVAGYFSSQVDGLEGSLTPSQIGEIDIASLTELINTPHQAAESEGIVGKIILDYEWYFAVRLDKREYDKFSEGAVVSLRFPFSSLKDVPAKVDKMQYSEADGAGIIFFRCSYFSKELALLRNENAQIALTSVSGIRVSSEAIRMGDVQVKDAEGNKKTETVRGVYVKNGNSVAFKRVEVLYENKDFYICAVKSDDKSYLQVYDEVIIEGKNLYDGKQLN